MPGATPTPLFTLGGEGASLTLVRLEIHGGYKRPCLVAHAAAGLALSDVTLYHCKRDNGDGGGGGRSLHPTSP